MYCKRVYSSEARTAMVDYLNLSELRKHLRQMYLEMGIKCPAFLFDDEPPPRFPSGVGARVRDEREEITFDDQRIRAASGSRRASSDT